MTLQPSPLRTAQVALYPIALFLCCHWLAVYMGTITCRDSFLFQKNNNKLLEVLIAFFKARVNTSNDSMGTLQQGLPHGVAQV